MPMHRSFAFAIRAIREIRSPFHGKTQFCRLSLLYSTGSRARAGAPIGVAGQVNRGAAAGSRTNRVPHSM